MIISKYIVFKQSKQSDLIKPWKNLENLAMMYLTTGAGCMKGV